MVNRTIAKFFAIMLQYNSKIRIVLQQYVKKKKKNFPSIFFSPTSILFSLFLLLSVSPSLFSPLYGPKRHLFSLFLLCWVRCLGCGSYVQVVGDGVGQWWLWLWVTPSLHHSRNGHTSFYESNHRDDHLVRFPIVKPLTLYRVSNAHMWGDVVFRPKIPHPLLGVY